MLILRTKNEIKQLIYSSRDEVDLTRYTVKSGELVTVFIEESSQYKRDINKTSEVDKKLIKKFKAEILNTTGLIGDGAAGGDAHPLSGLGRKSGSILMSKRINQIDRFNYRVYEPKSYTLEEEDDAGNLIKTTRKIIRVVLESCKGHKANGQGDYLKDPSLRNQANRKRNKKEDNNNK